MGARSVLETGERQELVSRITEDCAAIGGTVAGSRLETLVRLTLTLGQLKLLLRIVATGGATTNGLAEHLGISTAAVSPVVDKLVERGLVIRHPDPTDRRVKRLVASVEGADLVRAVFGVNDWTREQVLAAVDPPGLEALADGLAAVRAAVQALAAERADRG